jgi:serine phosphatase RsbU (regulator of sigma subunit)
MDSPITQNEADSTQRLKKLIAANQALAQVESLSQLLPLLLRSAQDVTESEAASILLYKPETETLEFTLAINDNQAAVDCIINKKFELRLGQGIAGYVGQTRESVIVQDVQHDQRFFRKADEASGFITRSILCTPILYRDELLGVVQVLNSKRKDFFEHEDLDLLESFSHLAAVAMIRSRMLEKMLEQERFQAQLDAASRIQQNFLPKIPELGHGSHIYAVTKPAVFVGGDFYDIITLPDDSIFLCVADVSGKGLPAALVGASLWSKLRSLATPELGAGLLMESLNDAMYEILSQQLFATMIIARYWADSGRMTLALAGHLPPILGAPGTCVSLDEIKGQPVGIDPHIRYEEIEIQIPPHGSLLIMTDGVTEARNARREFFGDQRVEKAFKELSGPPWGEHLVRSVESWRGAVDASDDLTVVEIWRNNS